MIQPTASFKENLSLLPAIETLAKIEIMDAGGEVIASIENQPGKQGSLFVYQYLSQEFGVIDVEAAQHGLAVFAEHTVDAKARPGAHPNIDHLFKVVEGGGTLSLRLISGA